MKAVFDHSQAEAANIRTFFFKPERPVQYTADQGKFYKIEVIGGNLSDWTTIGTTHTNSVVNGQLENLYVPGLVAGSYRMRLVIVDNGGGFLQAPYEVPFTVSH